MAYFSNGTEGEMWEEDNCCKCILGQESCPVYLAQLHGNYDQMVDGEQKGLVAEILNILIPTREDGFADNCRLRLLMAKPNDNEALLTALHDAIQRPMGVVPDSAMDFYNPLRIRGRAKQEI
ncbi:MAG: hypothetical protein AB7E51_14965 [Pseudodesulfovibrio sp.]|uniref:hypothetical protein n=1 Tax=Pseudodesulfovibrio sp. TaxID=2035812 RepID=UPI003D0B5058